jgi:DNA invertase Pin-like site-specific DNA recombinase
MGVLALIAEFENDIRRERQMDGIAKAKERGVLHFGRKPNSQRRRCGYHAANHVGQNCSSPAS